MIMNMKSEMTKATSTCAHIGHCVGHSPWNGNSQQMTGISTTPTMD